MSRLERFLLAPGLAAVWILAATGNCNAAEQPIRGLKIAVAANAPAEIRHAADLVLSACSSHPLLRAFAEKSPPSKTTDTKTLLSGPIDERAYSHLVIIGLPDDPLVAAVWQREARIMKQGFYVFGFGYLPGDVGYIESDRNPFLHSDGIVSTPFETEIVTISGSTPRGVALAANAFLKHSIINGVITAAPVNRTFKTLLDRDPLPQEFTLPDFIPAAVGEAIQVGVTMPAENEYREVLADAGSEPNRMWRVKYYLPGVWDGAGSAAAFDAYSQGLHRRAYGNSLWAAQFDTEQRAAEAAKTIAAAAKLAKRGKAWRGNQPPFGFQKESSGPLALWQHDDWVLMSTLPVSVTDKLLP